MNTSLSRNDIERLQLGDAIRFDLRGRLTVGKVLCIDGFAGATLIVLACDDDRVVIRTAEGLAGCCEPASECAEGLLTHVLCVLHCDGPADFRDIRDRLNQHDWGRPDPLVRATLTEAIGRGLVLFDGQDYTAVDRSCETEEVTTMEPLEPAEQAIFARVMAALSDGPARLDDLAKRTTTTGEPIPRDAVRDALDRLCTEGIVKVSRGMYALGTIHVDGGASSDAAIY